jgi:hypothetical protein
MPNPNKALCAAAAKWRTANQDHRGGVVLIWQGEACGWMNSLRDPHKERPGTYAVDEADHIFLAEGGDDYNGAKCWVATDLTGQSKAGA